MDLNCIGGAPQEGRFLGAAADQGNFMRIITVSAFVLSVAAVAAFSMSGPISAATQPTSSHQSQCEAQKKACLAAGTVTGQFGTRYVPPDVVKQCYDGYRMCIGQR